MIDLNAAFGHDLLKIPIRDTVADIEKHRVKNHALREMVPFEINCHYWALAFKLKSPHLPRASQSNQPQKLCDRTIKKAKDRGVQFGKRSALTDDQIKELRKKREKGILIRELMADYGLSKATIYRYLTQNAN